MSNGGRQDRLPHWCRGTLSTAPRWVRLFRGRDTFVGYTSWDGTTWTTVSAEIISVASTVYVGLARSSSADNGNGQFLEYALGQ
jgi:hypothetical protein